MYQILAEIVAVFRSSFNVYVYDSTELSVLPLPDHIWKNSYNVLNIDLLHPHIIPLIPSIQTTKSTYFFVAD